MESLITRLLCRDEGVRYTAYNDSKGFLTIGVGRLIDRRKGGRLRPSEVRLLLRNDIVERENELSQYLPWFGGLSEVRRAVLLSMAFQLGTHGLLGFRTFLSLAEQGRWNDAAAAMLESKWARDDSPGRAYRLAQAFATDSEDPLNLDHDPPPHLPEAP